MSAFILVINCHQDFAALNNSERSHQFMVLKRCVEVGVNRSWLSLERTCESGTNKKHPSYKLKQKTIGPGTLFHRRLRRLPAAQTLLHVVICWRFNEPEKENLLQSPYLKPSSNLELTAHK